MRGLATQVFELLSEPVRAILDETGIKEPTAPQTAAIPTIMAGRNVLLIAPTGSGKTEAALLPILDQMTKTQNRQGISVIYVTPLRALNRDMLKRILGWSVKLKFTVEIRHGDTPQRERRRQAVKPPDFLVTTPETLQAILPGKRMRSHLRHVKWVVIDEVHELAGDRRGAQLTIGLERLREVTDADFQRIGLSATVGNPDEIAEFLAGQGRHVETIQVQPPKEATYFVDFPYPSDEDHILSQTLYTSPEAAARLNRIWELVENHDSSLIFVNSRINAEMLGSKFDLLKRNVRVHHGSLPREERVRVETDFKAGSVKALVCTSTLELGIDIGSVDLVVQYMSPRQVSALIQRVGRSGHRIDRISEGIIVGVSTEDVLESIAAVKRAKRTQVEPVQVHYNALDVLAHQIAGILMDRDESTISTTLSIVRRSHAYRDLSEENFLKVVDFHAKLRTIRREGNVLARTGRTRQYYFENLSMIPDERRYPVIDVTTHQSVGILGEEFVMLHASPGINFIVKGKVWKIQKVAEDGNIYVTPVEDPTAAIPGWDGEILPVPYELAQETGSLRAEIADGLRDASAGSVAKSLEGRWPTELFALKKIVEELAEHETLGAVVPTDSHILVEGFDHYLIIHACFGERVNDTFGEIFEELLLRKGFVRNWWSDGYRILYELTINTIDLDLNELVQSLFHVSDEIHAGAMRSVLHRHSAFGYYMKFIAERFGALRRGLMLSGEQLKELALKFRLTPIYDEMIREAQMLHVDFERAKQILADVKTGRIPVSVFKDQEKPTPIAYHILNKHVEAPELIAPDIVAKDSIDRMRISLGNEIVNLLCFDCTHLMETARVNTLSQKPLCSNCGSGLMAVLFWSVQFVAKALEKKRKQMKLERDEEQALVRARRAADLVLSYGRRAIVAQCVYGVGPQTASRILAKMHDSDDEFYKDLLDAKLKFIVTRPFWDKT
jgi:ATP-dependent Lhr-like helicase